MTAVIVVLLVSCFFCLARIALGPTAADRTVGIDILGVIVVGFCAVMAVSTGRDFYLNVGLSWALLSFIGTLTLAKYLEGRGFDE
jgi:multicomponent Na+:H+ antiporter subunit F